MTEQYTVQGLVNKLNELVKTKNLNSRYYEDVQEAHYLVREIDKRFNEVFNLPEND